MKQTTYLLSIAFCISFLLFNCQSNNFDSTLLHGKWKVVSWIIDETEEIRNNQMDMEYAVDNTYSIDYGSEKEKGKYWIAGKYLHTIETGQSEKKVKLLILEESTMKFQMNRGGQIETVILEKE